MKNCANENIPILLASASPRRRELLKDIVDEFSVQVTDIDESIDLTDPQDIVMEIATRKAQAIKFDGLVIGSDTLVFDGLKPLGKPKTREQAFQMLKELSGKIHLVYSGVCIITPTQTRVFADKTDVWFKCLTDDEIWYYIDHYNPLDKAGAYGIQDGYCVEKINGSYSNVMGLPLEKLKSELFALGVKVRD